MRDIQVSRLKSQLEFVSVIEAAELVERADWKVDFRLVSLARVVIESGIDMVEVTEFLQALKISGVIYADIEMLLDELDQFVSEQTSRLAQQQQAQCHGFGSNEGRDVDSTSPAVPIDQAGLTLLCCSYASADSKLGIALCCILLHSSVFCILLYSSVLWCAALQLNRFPLNH